MPVREELSFLILVLSSGILVRVESHQGPVLSSAGDQCFGQTVTLTCIHPDPFQDSDMYQSESIAWAEDGVRLNFGDPATQERFTRTRLSSTSSTLSFTVTEEDQANKVVICSCFLLLTGGGGGREESDPPITIDVNAPPEIMSKPDGASGLLQWNPSPSCGTYNYQYIFTLTWTRIGDGSTGTVSTTENRYDFTGMPGGEYTAALKTRVTNFNLISQPVHDCWITIVQSPTILSTPDSTSGLLQWNSPSSSCSDYQYIFTLTWVRIGDGSTGTVITAENRYDFTGMTGGEYIANITAMIVGLNLKESESLIVPPFTTPMTDSPQNLEGSVFITALAAVSAVAGLFLIIIMVLAVILVGGLVRMRRRRREEGQERKRRDRGEANVPPVPMTTNPSYGQVQHSTEKKIPLYRNL